MKKLTVLTLCALSLAAGIAQAKDQRGQDPQQRIERMQQHLGLSDEQVAEMRSIREAGGGREEMRAVLTDEQRQKADAHHQKRKEKMREQLELTDAQVAEMERIRESGGGREEMRAVLTDEQRAKAEEMRSSYRDHKREQHRYRKGQ